jgi:Flp pilus assembly protein TadG
VSANNFRAIGARCSSDRGSALIEFGLSSIVFFMLVFGILQFGLGIWQYNVVSHLAKEGARRAAVCGSKTALSSADCDIQAYVTSRGFNMGVIATTTPTDISKLIAGDVVTVQTQKSFRPGTAFLPRATLTLRSRAQLIVSR